MRERRLDGAPHSSQGSASRSRRAHGPQSRPSLGRSPAALVDLAALRAGLLAFALRAERLGKADGQPRDLVATRARPCLELACVAGGAVAKSPVAALELGALPRAEVAVGPSRAFAHPGASPATRSRRAIICRTSWRGRGPLRRGSARRFGPAATLSGNAVAILARGSGTVSPFSHHACRVRPAASTACRRPSAPSPMRRCAASRIVARSSTPRRSMDVPGFPTAGRIPEHAAASSRRSSPRVGERAARRTSPGEERGALEPHRRGPLGAQEFAAAGCRNRVGRALKREGVLHVRFRRRGAEVEPARCAAGQVPGLGAQPIRCERLRACGTAIVEAHLVVLAGRVPGEPPLDAVVRRTVVGEAGRAELASTRALRAPRAQGEDPGPRAVVRRCGACDPRRKWCERGAGDRVGVSSRSDGERLSLRFAEAPVDVGRPGSRSGPEPVGEDGRLAAVGERGSNQP